MYTTYEFAEDGCIDTFTKKILLKSTEKRMNTAHLFVEKGIHTVHIFAKQKKIDILQMYSPGE